MAGAATASRFELQVLLRQTKSVIARQTEVEPEPRVAGEMDVQHGNALIRLLRRLSRCWYFEQAARDVVQIEILAEINEFIPREPSDHETRLAADDLGRRLKKSISRSSKKSRPKPPRKSHQGLHGSA
jgi:hypothetical protein